MSRGIIATLVVSVAVLSGGVVFAMSGDAGGGRTAAIGDTTGLSINDVSVTEGHSGSTYATFRITRGGSTTGTVQLTYATFNGNAAGGSDFDAADQPVTFNAGDSYKDVRILIRGDTVAEANETFSVRLDKVTGSTIVDGTGWGTIVNDDAAFNVIDAAAVAEGNSGTKQVAVKITRTGSITGTSKVTWQTANDTALATSDYVTGSDTVTFNAGETEKLAMITIKGDTAFESNERLFVRLYYPSGAGIVDFEGNVPITNDDEQPATTSWLTVNNVTVTEGNSGSKTATFRITRHGSSTGTVSATYTTFDSSALDTSDYTWTGGPVVFYDGVTYKDIPVVIRGDTVAEANETFGLRLEKVTGATLASGPGQGTIVNDEAAFNILDATVAEGNSGTSQVPVKITRTGSTTATAQVRWTTANDTAVRSRDYVEDSAVVTFNPGETEKLALITINGNTTPEPDKRFFVHLYTPVGAGIVDWGANVTITNDDVQPDPASTDALVKIQTGVLASEGNSGTTQVATFRITRTGSFANTVTLTYATVDGSALATSDYVSTKKSLTFNPGDEYKDVTIPIRGDTVNEMDEGFAVQLENITGAGPGERTKGLALIIDDD